MAIQKSSLAAVEHDWFATRSGLTNKLDDSSINANHGTLAGGATFQVEDGIGDVLVLNGTDGSVNIGDVAPLDVAFTTMTLEAWVCRTATQGAEAEIVGKLYDTYELGLITTNRIKVDFTIGGVQSTYYSTNDVAGKVVIGTWHHIAAVYDGANVHLYKDGVECSAAAYPITGSIATNNQIASIGSRIGTSLFFNGRLKDVRIYSRALSPTEISNSVNKIAVSRTNLIAEYRCKPLLTPNIPLNDHKAAYFSARGFGSNASIFKPVSQMEAEWLSNLTGVNGTHNPPDQWREAVAKAGFTVSTSIDENRKTYFANKTGNP